jgi:hypothetical protein
VNDMDLFAFLKNHGLLFRVARQNPQSFFSRAPGANAGGSGVATNKLKAAEADFNAFEAP